MTATASLAPHPAADPRTGLDRGIDRGACVLAGATMGYHAALLVNGGLIVMVVVGVLAAAALVRFIDADAEAPTAEAVGDRSKPVRLWAATAAITAATAIAIWPGPRNSREVTALVAAVLMAGLALLAPRANRRPPAVWVEGAVIVVASIAALDLAGAVTPPAPLSLPFTLVGTFAGTVWAAFRPGSTPAPVTSGWRPTRHSYAILTASGSAFAFGLLFRGVKVNLDNLYYIRKATTYADQWTGFTEGDVMLGLDDAPHVPGADLYQAFEAFVGLISSVTRVGPAALVVVVVGPIIAMLVPFASARLGASLGARNPTMVGVVTVAIMMTVNKLLNTSNFTIGKTTQGKGVFTLVVIPLLLAAAIDYVARPGAARLRRLLVVGIGGVGLTATASALVPVAVGVAVLGAWRSSGLEPWLGRQRKPAHGVATVALAIYPVIVLALATLADGGDDGVPTRGFRETLLKGLIGNAGRLGAARNRAPFVVSIVLVFGALLWSRRRVATRYLAVMWAIVVLVLLNPDLLQALGDRFDVVRGSWRLAWLVPTGVFVAAACDIAVDRFGRLGAPVAAGALAVILALGPPSPLTNQSGFPDVDTRAGAEPVAWSAAGRLHELTEPGDVLLVPRPIVVAITLRYDDRHAHLVRSLYLPNYDGYEIHGAERRLLESMVAPQGPSEPRAVAQVLDALDRVGVDAVCVPPDPALALRMALEAAFEPHPDATGLPCTLWVRPERSPA